MTDHAPRGALEYEERKAMTDHTPTPRCDAYEIVDGVRYTLQPRGDLPDWPALARTLERELAEVHRSLGEFSRRLAQETEALADYKRLEEILEGYSDVVDGSYGVPEPNTAMSILTEWRGQV